MFSLQTILKAIELVGDATPAAKALYEGFIAVTRGDTQAELKQRYADMKARTDDLHNRVQGA